MQPIVPDRWYKQLVAYLWYDVVLCLYAGIMCFLNDKKTSPPALNIEEIEKRTGHVAVITGGPRGLALGLIRRLAQLDYQILIGARDIQDSKIRLSKFSKRNRNLRLNNISLFHMDMKSLTSVTSFAHNVLKETGRIDVLFCNAGINRVPFEVTEDGHESQFQVNYLSNFLLIHLLLHRMKETSAEKGGPGQIIFSCSTLYQYGTFNLDELSNGSLYTPSKLYYDTKLYQVMCVRYLQKLLDDQSAQVKCYAVHPGMIPTDMWFTAGGCLIWLFAQLTKKMFRSIENGADTLLWPVLWPKYFKQGGLYIESDSSLRVIDEAANNEFQAALYRRSLQLAGINKNILK